MKSLNVLLLWNSYRSGYSLKHNEKFDKNILDIAGKVGGIH